MTVRAASNPSVAALFLGVPRLMPAGPGAREPWSSSFIRDPVSTLVLESGGPRGNLQVDRENHGGVDKAVLAYAAHHYPAWRQELEREDLGPGGWGENLVVEGQDETTVCIGDRFASGEAVVEVSQPRQPCWKLGARWALPGLPRLTLASGRTGWYLRVVHQGTLRIGDRLERVDRCHAEWTVARASRVFHDAAATREDLAALAALPRLAAAWRRDLARRLSRLPRAGAPGSHGG